MVDVESVGDISEGECVVLAREGIAAQSRSGDHESQSGDEGIRSIVSMDDSYVWTATGSAEVKRWKDVGRRVNRLSSATEDDDGTSYQPISGGEVTLNVPPEDRSTSILDPISHAQDLAASAPLLRSESRDSRQIAFGPTPTPRSGGVTGTGATSGLRHSRMSGTSLASNSSIGADDAANGHMQTLNGIPYESLVCLGLPDSPYSLGFGGRQSGGYDDEDDGPGGQGGMELLKPDGVDGHRGSMQVERTQNPSGGRGRARQQFEERDVASEAVPLCRQPNDIIAGRPGLVRSIILNDRQHVLSIDTDGHIAAWNILSGRCLGQFSAEDVAAAIDLEHGVKPDANVRKHSVEVLELVRNRVEGETMIITWCQVDTKIGSLVIHLEEGRVFDAEVYADELGLQYQAKDDVRRECCSTITDVCEIDPPDPVNLGKWALANLFKGQSSFMRDLVHELKPFIGLVKAEENSVIAMSPKVTTTNLPPVQRSPQSRPIPIDRPQAAPSHRQRSMTGSFSSGAPSLDIPGLATSASTPAVLPDMDLSRSAPANGGAWQSMAAAASRNGAGLSPIAPTPPSTAALSPTVDMSAARDDYFSMRRKEQSPTRAEDKVVPATPGSAVVPPTPSTPGGSKLKFSFGKKKKSETPMTTVEESKEAAPEPEEVVSVPSHPLFPFSVRFSPRKSRPKDPVEHWESS